MKQIFTVQSAPSACTRPHCSLLHQGTKLDRNGTCFSLRRSARMAKWCLDRQSWERAPGQYDGKLLYDLCVEALHHTERARGKSEGQDALPASIDKQMRRRDGGRSTGAHSGDVNLVYVFFYACMRWAVVEIGGRQPKISSDLTIWIVS